MKHTFENFRVDDSNREAYFFCKNLAEEVKSVPRIAYIHGTAGIGKTHLMKAVKHQLEEELYLSVELIEGSELVELFIEIFKACKNTDYPIRQIYPLFADADVLLIDNIRCLIGRSATQELVAELLCDMAENGKTVLFSGEKTFEEMGVDAFKKYLEEHEVTCTEVYISTPGFAIKQDFLNDFIEKQELHLEEIERENILKWSVTFRELNAVLNQISFQQKVDPTSTNTEILKKVLEERGKYYRT